MTTYHTKRVLNADRDRLFEIVADVEQYPRFLPIWKSARVMHRQDTTYHTVQEVGFGPVQKRFKTQTVLDSPHRIEITSNDRLFRNFIIQWAFVPTEKGTEAAVYLNWKMSSRLLQRAIDAMLPATADMMISSFSRQATTCTNSLVLQPA